MYGYGRSSSSHDEDESSLDDTTLQRPHRRTFDDSTLGSITNFDDSMATSYLDDTTTLDGESSYDDLTTRYEDETTLTSRYGDEETTRYDDETTRYDDTTRYEDETTLTSRYGDDETTRYDDETTRYDDTTGYDDTTRYNDETTTGYDDTTRFDDSTAVEYGGYGTSIYDDDTTGYEDETTLDEEPDDRHDHPLENPRFYFTRRPRATTPGAVAVVRRGMEATAEDDEWDPTAPQDSERVENGNGAHQQQSNHRILDATVTPMMKNLHQMSTRRMILYALIALLVLGGAGAGIAFAVSGGSDSGGSDPSGPTEPPVTKCDFAGQEQPDPILQCACDGNITVLSEDLISNYAGLRVTVIRDLYPDDSFDYPFDSCEPANVALLQLATDDTSIQSPERLQNRYLLYILYAAWRGMEWTVNDGWLTSDPECTWFGITCNDDDTLLSDIQLYDNNLRGFLMTELGFFQSVRTFMLGMNELEGSIPSEIAGATSLEILNLDRNKVDGSIPASIGGLVNLREFHAELNLLTGTIPIEVVDLTSLETLSCAENGLTGSIPDEIGLMSSLKVLKVARNSLVGSIPEDVGLLANLEELISQENQHTGSIPTTVYSATNLRSLILGFNDFEENPLLTEIGQLTNLESLILPNLQLNGTIPEEIGALTKLTTLFLQSNALTGTIPSSMGTMVAAKIILMHFNRFEGSMPQEVCQLTTDGVLENVVVSCGVSSGPDCDCCVDCTEL